MKELKLNEILKLEKKELKQLRGGDKPPCGCGCGSIGDLDNTSESHKSNKR